MSQQPMKHRDAERIAELCETVGQPLVPWQRAFLERLEAASMDAQFADIVTRAKLPRHRAITPRHGFTPDVEILDEVNPGDTSPEETP